MTFCVYDGLSLRCCSNDSCGEVFLLETYAYESLLLRRRMVLRMPQDCGCGFVGDGSVAIVRSLSDGLVTVTSG